MKIRDLRYNELMSIMTDCEHIERQKFENAFVRFVEYHGGCYEKEIWKLFASYDSEVTEKVRVFISQKITRDEDIRFINIFLKYCVKSFWGFTFRLRNQCFIDSSRHIVRFLKK